MVFLSKESFFTLNDIQEKAYMQLINKVSLKLEQKPIQYAPFMSCIELVEKLELLKVYDYYYLNKRLIPLVETSKDRLSNFEEIFYTKENGSLGYFYDHARSSFKIAYDPTEVDLINFKNNIENCFFIIKNASPLLYNFCCKFVLNIVPIIYTGTLFEKVQSFSSHKAIGTVFLSYSNEEKFNSIDYIIKIAHELGHQLLYLYQTGDDLILSDHFSLVYSGVRKAFRPAIMAFHASIALVHMKYITNVILKEDIHELILSFEERSKIGDLHEDYTISLLKTVDSIIKNCSLTDFGNKILNSLNSI